MTDCLHIELTDEGVCTSCGVDTSSQEYIDSLPEPPDFKLGDIVGIVRVAQESARDFLKLQDMCRDPHNPTQPKIKWVGTQLVRPPREAVWAEVVRPSYESAKKLGYKGKFEDWENICMEYVLLLKDLQN